MSKSFAYSTGDLKVASAVLNAALGNRLVHGHAPPPHRFVTVSRQAGAGGRTFARQLVERLNVLPHDRLWSCWDQELVEKVSEDHGIEKAIVAKLEDAPHNWLEEMFENVSSAEAKRHPDEFMVYRRVAMTVQALAEAGNAVIVGRGSVFVAHGIAGGLHVRLVAPVAWRVENVARRDGIDRKQAAAKVAQIDRSREMFYKRHWPDRKLTPEEFTVTFNSERLTVGQMVQAVLPLLQEAPVRV